jgi:lysozyme family protein
VADVQAAFMNTMSWEDPQLEGKVVPDPTKADPSAVSRFGVNSAAHPQAVRDGFYEMSRDAALQYAEDVYKYDYFQPVNGYGIVSQIIANKFADLAFNESPRQATLIVQRALKFADRNIDGVVGTFTLAAINAADPNVLLVSIKAKAKDFYVEVVSKNPEKAADLPEWLRRVNA